MQELRGKQGQTEENTFVVGDVNLPPWLMTDKKTKRRKAIKDLRYASIRHD